MTPLYKFLKSNGTSVYVFPSSAEDISVAFQNENKKVHFSKFALLNLPKQEISSEPKYFDFDSAFKGNTSTNPPSNFSEAIIESLRNYVANHEVVIRESKLNNESYFYNSNDLETTSETIFFKWAKKLNLFQLERAIPDDEYFKDHIDFVPNDLVDDEYHPEYLWKEREVANLYFNEYSVNGTNLLLKYYAVNNYIVDDLIDIVIDNAPNMQFTGRVRVLSINIVGSTLEVLVENVDGIPFSGSNSWTIYEGKTSLVYNRLLQYIGEVSGVSNVQQANKSYTEVYANIPDHVGQTPDVLFRTKANTNYRPNLTFPIIPSQLRPEIYGANDFNSPIISNPQNYPGGYMGQFDTDAFTYESQTGDSLRRVGNYYGVSGTRNSPIFNPKNIDGISLDLNKSHYVKMNIPGRVSTTFENFNGIEINNNPPKSFEYNAILWYYTVEENGVSKENLYGITFLDHPDNNPKPQDIGLKFPSHKKLVANGNQDGTSYIYNLSLNYNIINDNSVDTFNPDAINSIFSMSLFNDAMASLSRINDSFMAVLSENNDIKSEITHIKQLVYNQSDIASLNMKMTQMEKLLRLYSTSQIVNSDTINVNAMSGDNSTLTLDVYDTKYTRIDNLSISNFYTSVDIVPIYVNVPLKKNLCVNVNNNDASSQVLSQNLKIVLDRDLSLRQSIDINIDATPESTQNKKLDIFISSNSSGVMTEELLISNINLPVYYNSTLSTFNSAYLQSGTSFGFDIDFSSIIHVSIDPISSLPNLTFSLLGNLAMISNSVNIGDSVKIDNLMIGVTSPVDYSGQYIVRNVAGNVITLDISSNNVFVSFVGGSNIVLHDVTVPTSILYGVPSISYNKGMSLNITRISDSTIISERYRVEIK